jgi:hypothetical protein
MSQLLKRLRKLEAGLPQPWCNPLVALQQLALSRLSGEDRVLVQQALAANRIDLLGGPNQPAWDRWDASFAVAARELDQGHFYAADLWL